MRLAQWALAVWAAAAGLLSAASPTLTSVSPTSYRIGDQAGINLTGLWQAAPLKVTLGPYQLPTNAVTETSANCSIASVQNLQPGIYSLTVEQNGLRSNALSFEVLSSGFQVTSVTPDRIPLGSPDTPVTIRGQFPPLLWYARNVALQPAPGFTATEQRLVLPASLLAIEGTLEIKAYSQATYLGSATVQVYWQAPAPVLSSISPTSFPKGQDGTLTITGQNFTAPATLIWNGSTRIPLTVESSTIMRAALPASLLSATGNYPVKIEVGGSTLNGYSVDVLEVALPLLSGISPRSTLEGSPALTLTLTGTGLTPTTRITWEHNNTLSSTYVSPTTINAQVPAALLTRYGFYQISAWTGAAEASIVSFYVEPNPTPEILALSPNQAPAGSAALRLFVRALNTLDDTRVKVLWNGTPLTTQNTGAGYLYADVPASLLANPGTAQVTVMQNTKTSAPMPFEITGQTRFTLTSIEPNSIDAGSPDFTLTARGEGFDSQSMINWNGNHFPSRLVSSTTLTATIPAAYLEKAGTLPVMVTGTTRSTNQLTFTIRGSTTPITTGLTPTSVPAGSPAVQLIIDGQNFDLNATVFWNLETLEILNVTARRITALIPAKRLVTPGVVSIRLKVGGIQTAPLTFLITSGSTLTSLDPASAPAGSKGFALSVAGSGFLSASVVRWNGAPLPTTCYSAIRLGANVPASLVANAGSATITVTTGNEVTAGLPFQITPAGASANLTALQPSTAQAGAGPFALTLSGSGFTSAATAEWNGSVLATTFVSAAELRAAVPAALLTTEGVASVAIRQDGALLGPLPFTITAVPEPGLAPELTSISPEVAPRGSGALTIALAGKGFSSTSTAYWGGRALATYFLDASHLAAEVPAALLEKAGKVAITVSGSNELPFRVTLDLKLKMEVTPGEVAAVTLQLQEPVDVDLSGTLLLRFRGDAAEWPGSFSEPDARWLAGPAVRLAAGTKETQSLLWPGSVAGQLLLGLASLEAEGMDVLPAEAPGASLEVPRALPELVAWRQAGRALSLDLLANTRELGKALVTLAGDQILEFDLKETARSWFASDEGRAGGGVVRLTLEVEGTVKAVKVE